MSARTISWAAALAAVLLATGGGGARVAAAPAVRPRATESSTSFYDAARGRMLVFGGRAPGHVWNSLWSLALTGRPRWTRLAPGGTPPPPRYAHTMVYDSAHDRLIVYGGTDDGIRAMDDVWQLTLGGTPRWTRLATVNPPRARLAHVAVYDPEGDRMIIFGGWNGEFLDDTWQLSLGGTPTWTRLAEAGPRPTARDFASAIYDPVGRRMVLFGGNAMGERVHPERDGVRVTERAAFATNDLWSLSLGRAPQWSELDPAGTAPGPRLAHETLYDSKRHRLVVMGGTDAQDWKDDAFALTLDGAPEWMPILVDGDGPSARSGEAFVYDAARDRVILFAGKSATDVFDDGWILRLGGPPRWERIETRAAAADDPGWI